MGAATANTILVVAFARDHLDEHGNAEEAGEGRICPVLITALAMIVGFIPKSLSNTTNGSLGWAVIGGLIVATFTTLPFVPNVFANVHRNTQTCPKKPRTANGCGGAAVQDGVSAAKAEGAAAERTQARTTQLQNPANLILAVGGGWRTKDLPTGRGVLPFEPLDVFHFDRNPRPDGTGQECGINASAMTGPATANAAYGERGEAAGIHTGANKLQ